MVSITRARPIEFRLFAPQAKRVSLAGNFNDWNTRQLSARKDPSGNWSVKINLKPGRYEYKFFVDGSWLSDPACSNSAMNSFGTENSVVEIK
jgi:1,4-alpha-glucan branching enzyme